MLKITDYPKRFLLKLIRFYQKWFSIDQGFPSKFVHTKVCRFAPYCSEYMYQSIEKHGIAKGGLKGVYRILRCNPFTKGGYDPVE
ncbi:membrane protein insertion efficiency factor YidD [candidate division WWE3 bacterium CG_4_9_14_3_um_filter_34_6]|uniref:Putative membrane protein insertion efficiency factor n=1 Tax=candidate division WWE3 bacterium CG_4_9_14_3_um_filter_34_6 TaxID=1975079 RepID=A0A2M7X2W4_UNCKA|nr:MAG: membrane protein insertion efficiency factor YidD [candidate division WWE3 bacterium CG_4_9_14_3_um_filter_34_6]